MAGNSKCDKKEFYERHVKREKHLLMTLNSKQKNPILARFHTVPLKKKTTHSANVKSVFIRFVLCGRNGLCERRPTFSTSVLIGRAFFAHDLFRFFTDFYHLTGVRIGNARLKNNAGNGAE